MDMQNDIFSQQPYGKVALRKLAPVSPNFRLYSVAWLGDKPSEWEVMRVIGAEFREAKTGPRKGQMCILVKGTTRTAFVTTKEIAEEERTNP
jgi:hypothetical protein